MTGYFDDMMDSAFELEPVGRINILLADLFGFVATGVALGAVVFSVKPLYQTIKDRKWSDLPLLSVPFLIGTYMINLQYEDDTLNTTPAVFASTLLDSGLEIFDDQLNWDEIFGDDDGDWDDDEE